jgi:hypothetical protein
MRVPARGEHRATKLRLALAVGAAQALLVGAFTVPNAAGDSFVVSPAAAANLPAAQQPAYMAQAQQFANGMMSHLELKLDEVRRVCDLSASQRGKLRVAAKGAIEYAVQDWLDAAAEQLAANAANAANPQANVIMAPAGAGRRGAAQLRIAAPAAVAAPAAAARDVQAEAELRARLAEFQQLQQTQLQLQRQIAMQQQAAQQADQNVAKLREVEAALQLQQQLLQQRIRAAQPIQQDAVVQEVLVMDDGAARVVRRVVRAPRIPALDVKGVETNQVWIAALANTLSDEQKQRWAAASADRSAFLAAPRNQYVAYLDQLLLLDNDQRKKINELVGRAFEQPALQRLSTRVNEVSPASLNRLFSQLNAGEMNQVLSPLQYSRWQDVSQSQGMRAAAQRAAELEGGQVLERYQLAAPVPGQAADPVGR